MSNFAVLSVFPDDWYGRNEHDRQGDRGEVVFDVGDGGAEGVAQEGDAGAPGEGADDVVGEEGAVAHTADAGEHWRDGADDGNEAGENDGADAVLFVERFRARHVFFAEEARIFAREDLGTELRAEPVAGAVAEDRGEGAECRQ